MISDSESYFKLLISVSCCWLLATKVRAKKRDICSSSLISTEIGMYLSNWFYPRQQIEPTNEKRTIGTLSFQQSFSACYCQMVTSSRWYSQPKHASGHRKSWHTPLLLPHSCDRDNAAQPQYLFLRPTGDRQSCGVSNDRRYAWWSLHLSANFQRCLCHGVFEIGEHLTSFIWWIAYQFQGFLTDWVMHDVFCFLHSCGDIHHTIAAVWLYLLPSEFLNVALSQCR